MDNAEEKAKLYYAEIVALSNDVNSIGECLFPGKLVSVAMILEEIRRLKAIEQSIREVSSVG